MIFSRFERQGGLFTHAFLGEKGLNQPRKRLFLGFFSLIVDQNTIPIFANPPSLPPTLPPSLKLKKASVDTVAGHVDDGGPNLGLFRHKSHVRKPLPTVRPE